MEVRALSTRLSVNVFLLLGLQIQNVCKAYKTAMPHVNPNKLQFFEYDTMSIDCEMLELSSKWTLKWTRKENATKTTTEEMSTGFLTIAPAYASHTGEYWCENEEGERSSSVNITVTAGEVILESQSVPLTEGDSITLTCRKRMSELNPSADFYKDGNLTKTGYVGTYTINKISKSDEGFYKCSISGAGESPESWLSVRAETKDASTPRTPPSNGYSYYSILIPVVLTVLFFAGLLLVVVLLRYYNVGCFSSESSTQREDSGLGEASAPDANIATYATVTKFRKNREPSSSRSSAERAVIADFKPSFGSEDVVYSSIK